MKVVNGTCDEVEVTEVRCAEKQAPLIYVESDEDNINGDKGVGGGDDGADCGNKAESDTGSSYNYYCISGGAIWGKFISKVVVLALPKGRTIQKKRAEYFLILTNPRVLLKLLPNFQLFHKTHLRLISLDLLFTLLRGCGY